MVTICSRYFKRKTFRDVALPVQWGGLPQPTRHSLRRDFFGAGRPAKAKSFPDQRSSSVESNLPRRGADIRRIVVSAEARCGYNKLAANL